MLVIVGGVIVTVVSSVLIHYLIKRIDKYMDKQETK